MTAGVARGQDYAFYPFVIESFHSDITVRQDSRLDVTETIRTTFNIPRRGIIRVIPETFDTGFGTSRRTAISNISVTDENGKAQTILVTRGGHRVNIRVGDEDIEFPAGTQKTYKINYRITNAVNWFGAKQDWEPHAEVYWNVTGNEWDTTIKQASARVTFPTVTEDNQVRARMFFGYTGSIEGLDQFAAGEVARPGSEIKLTKTELSVRHTEPLEPGEGMTFVLAVPATVLPEPSWLQKVGFFLDANRIVVFPFLVLGAMTVIWLRIGRDPKGKPVEVQFEPPLGLSATECGFLIDERVDPKDVSAAIVSLAVKGYLKIQTNDIHGRFKQSETFLNVPTADPPNKKPLTTFENDLLQKLRTLGPTVDFDDLKTKVSVAIPAWSSSLEKSMVKLGLYHIAPNTAKAITGCGGIVLVLLTILGLSGLLNNMGTGLIVAIAAILSVVIILAFASLMSRRTKLGADVFQQLKGFERAMSGREHYMTWFSKTNMDMAKYEEYLPYAIMFGLVKEWTNICETVVTDSPSWYVSTSPHGTFNAVMFSNHLTRSTNAIGKGATTMPRTSSSGGGSGFSGGGSSGGGFGGGGGSSW